MCRWICTYVSDSLDAVTYFPSNSPHEKYSHFLLTLPKIFHLFSWWKLSFNFKTYSMRYHRHSCIFICPFQKKEIPCLIFWKNISPYIHFSCFLPEVGFFLEILKQFIMWFVIFFYKLHVFSDMNVKDIEISIFYYWAVLFHHRKRHCWPKVNIINCLTVNLIGRKKLAGRFLKKRSS